MSVVGFVTASFALQKDEILLIVILLSLSENIKINSYHFQEY